jgi:hypothetical protein
MTTAAKPKPDAPKRKLDIIALTPDMAIKLLEYNKFNRPLSQTHVDRIARQIAEDKWRFNGDTIKIAASGDIVDGQHRLWAVASGHKSVETCIVHGVMRDAFATIDTLSKTRGFGDTLMINGVTRYRATIAGALGWLLRYQRGTISTNRDSKNKIENSDIEQAYGEHHGLMRAAEIVRPAVAGLASPAVITFLYYVFADRDQELADRFIKTLEDPAGISARDPFFRFRVHLTAAQSNRRDIALTIALAIKAANHAKAGDKIDQLKWVTQGKFKEEFPKLKV